MDNNKDNNKGQFPNVVFDLKNIGFFNGDDYSLFLYKKTEKLVAGLYMVSNLIPESDPVKGHVRDAGLSLLSQAISFGTVNSNERDEYAHAISATTLHIISLLEISFYAGHISAMNHRVLKREFSWLLDFIEKREKLVKEKNGFVLSENFFSTPEKYIVQQTPTQSKEAEQFKGHTNQSSQVKYGHQNGYGNRVPKPVIKDIGERKDSRKAQILSLLKKEDNLTIKDFSKVIPDCSEKTIQRELLQLVSEGVLKKVGERRWSKYSLNK